MGNTQVVEGDGVRGREEERKKEEVREYECEAVQRDETACFRHPVEQVLSTQHGSGRRALEIRGLGRQRGLTGGQNTLVSVYVI